MPMSRRQLFQLTAGTMVPATARVGLGAVEAIDARRWWRPTGPRTNVLVLVLDDVGFADLGCYGSEVSTPALDGLAATGLRFANFHVTPLCSPTRASLLTGRDHHAVGVGTIPEWAMPRPTYRGFISQEVSTLPELLRGANYGCYAVGKWHLNLVSDANAAGPFEHWPTSRGFDRWYGFHGPIADHWHPELFENTSFLSGPRTPPYHLSEDLVDHAISYVRDHVTAAPDRPFFLYVAFGACHWPLQVPASLVARYRGRYDPGWDALRDSRLTRQLDLGVVPVGTRNAPSNASVPAWASLTAPERQVAARLQEVYAAFLEHTDLQIGRLLAFLDATGLRDDTLILALSDNGASAEGGRLGAVDVRRNYYASPETIEDLLQALDALGDDTTFAAYARGWAQASNTPLRWFKGTAFGGGTRAPLVVAHPGLLAHSDRGTVRHQFGHVNDLLPTVLDFLGGAAAIEAASSGPVRLAGRSLLACIRSASAPTPKHWQFFETNGQRALWVGGWKAVAEHAPGRAFDLDPWTLYRLDEDFNELVDRSAEFPDRLADMRRRWTELAEQMGVLPMDDRNAERLAANAASGRTRFVLLAGMARIDRLSAPDIYDRSFRLTARIQLNTGRASGVLITAGTALAGYEWLLLDGRPVFAYVLSRAERFVARATEPLPAGEHEISVHFERLAPASGLATLRVADRDMGSVVIPRQWRSYAVHAGLRCGSNPGAPVTRFYEGALPFEGHLESVVIELL